MEEVLLVGDADDEVDTYELVVLVARRDIVCNRNTKEEFWIFLLICSWM